MPILLSPYLIPMKPPKKEPTSPVRARVLIEKTMFPRNDQ
jgi:hypothetical protein